MTEDVNTHFSFSCFYKLRILCTDFHYSHAYTSGSTHAHMLYSKATHLILKRFIIRIKLALLVEVNLDFN